MLIAGNWKMNLRVEEARALASSLASVEASTGVQVGVFPPYPWILPVREALGSSGVLVGAQNCHAKASGAFTGEVSAPMLADICDAVIIGHSERRHVFGESDAEVGEKAVAVLNAGLTLILCVGETLDEREAGQAEAVVNRQLAAAFDALREADSLRTENITIAYEPVWAIGTGVAATSDDAQAMSAAIRAWLSENVSRDAAVGMHILYGGSVTPDNASELLAQPDVDGALVGGASLKAEGFAAIVAAANAVVGQ
jgi:triosephosphate isomerase